MPPTTTFALIRHGQTDWNAEFRIQGTTDIPLNELGRGQANAAVGPLAAFHNDERDWDFIVSSPLSRAADTADFIATGLGVDVTHRLPAIVERNYGDAEGLQAGPELEALRIPNGFLTAESEADVAQRGIEALQNLAQEFPGARIIVVSHGTLIRLTLNKIFDLSVGPISNAALTVARSSHAGWHLDHLNGEAT
ncbi:MAG: histidine phosphatase family protein [Actinomycetales bacterium]|nr:histidine phosphatase family protein [Actinomycetales bacterium]